MPETGKKFVALLRGINVSGQKKIKMADLRNSLSKGGIEDVQTYIQSGNIVFRSIVSDTYKMEKSIHKIIQEDFGFDVPVIVLSKAKLDAVLSNNPFTDSEKIEKSYYTILEKIPTKEALDRLYEKSYEPEEFHYADGVVYLYSPAGAAKSKLSNNLFESKLKMHATTRNGRTLHTLKSMLQE